MKKAKIIYNCIKIQIQLGLTEYLGIVQAVSLIW